MAESRVWIFTGEKDTVVNPGVVAKTDAYYQKYVSKDELIFRTSIPAEHAWVTSGYGQNCSFLGDPYINNCGFDAAGGMLTHFYDQPLRAPGVFNASNLQRFDQSEYVVSKSPFLISLGETGYIYTPSVCQNGRYQCRLHVVSHKLDCSQTEREENLPNQQLLFARFSTAVIKIWKLLGSSL